MTTKGLKVVEDDFVRIKDSIATAAEMGKRLKQCGISQRGIIVLLADLTALPKRYIKIVLDALPDLKKFLN